MGFTEYIPAILRRKRVILITFLATIVVAVMGFFLIPETHTAETIIRVIPYSAGEPPYAQIVYAERIMNTYVEIAESSPVLDEMRARVGIGTNQPHSVSVGIIPDSELIRITVDDPNPDIALSVADTLAIILIEQRSIRDVRLSVVQPGNLVTSPSILKNLVYAFVVIVLGAIGGIGIALFVDNLDSTLYTAEEIMEVTQLPLLAKIPEMDTSVITWQDTPPWYDAFFRLRKTLLSQIDLETAKTILFISALPAEGKSTITTSIAQSLAQSGISTMVVDGNYHNPSIHDLLDVPNDQGFLDALETNRLMSASIHETKFKDISALPAGHKPSDAINLVSSENLTRLAEKFKAKASVVLMDSPAFLVASETSVFAQVVDEVILIVSAGVCDKSSLEEMMYQLGQNDITPVGVIINCLTDMPTLKYWKAYYPA
ncbi:hypothetical protein KQH54_03820 [bacterium]|nr:hypothetical protein [bacterium]